MTDKRKKSIVAAILLAMFLFGFYFAKDAGVYFDEASEQKILFNNVLQYGDTFHIGKVSGWLRKQGAVPICEDIEMDHGIAPYYLSIPFFVIFEGRADIQSMIWHLYTYVLFFCGVIWMYRLGYEVFHSRKTALAGAMMLFFSPKIFADGLYNNKDTVLLSAVIIMLFYGVRFLERKDVKSAVFLGLAAGVACNLKVSGIYVFAMIGGYYILLLIVKKKWNRKTFRVGVIAAVTGFACYLLLTPAIWGQGFHLIRFLSWSLSNTTKFSRMDEPVLFEGNTYRFTVNPLPWYYLPKLILFTTPVYVLVLILTSLILWGSRCSRGGRPEQVYPLFASIPAIPLIAAMVSHPNLYNGWRHFYFIYGAFIFMASYALHRLLHEFRYRRGAVAILTLLLEIQVCGIAKSGIGSVAYMNLLAGGNAQGKYELDYYGVTSEKIMKSLADRYGRINLCSDSKGSVLVTWQALPVKYQEQIHLLYSEEEMQKALDNGENVYGLVNTSYDFVDDEDVKWLEEWTAWGNTYVKIRQY